VKLTWLPVMIGGDGGDGHDVSCLAYPVPAISLAPVVPGSALCRLMYVPAASVVRTAVLVAGA
jgi:hypothetical protein